MCREAALGQGERVSRASAVRWAVDIVLIVAGVLSVLFEPVPIATTAWSGRGQRHRPC